MRWLHQPSQLFRLVGLALAAAAVLALEPNPLSARQADFEHEGTLEVRVEDSVTGATLEHFLNARGRKLRLHPRQALPAYLTGTQVRVRGRQRGETLELNGQSDVTILAAALPNTHGAQRTIVILVNFQDRATVPYSAATAAQVTFQSTSDFYRENSYGLTWLEGDVAGWFTIPMSYNTCNSDQLASLADQAATASGVNLSNYLRKVYAFPNNACSWWGLGTIGGSPSRAWINGTYALKVVGHELGHNFGAYHSRSRSCDSGGCTTVEYGDDRDIMGTPQSGHMNAFQKERIGWLNAGGSTPAIQAVSEAGTYFVDALHAAGGTKALKILKATNGGARTYYYVESRAQAGFDNQATGGVIVHSGTENTANSSDQIDLAPQTSAFDSLLDPSQTFVDASAGITIRTVSSGLAGSYVDVSFDASCVRRAPALAISPIATVSIQAGSSFTYTLTVTNLDDVSCSTTPFSLQASVPSGWSSSSGSTSPVPGASSSTQVLLTVPLSASGTISIPFSASRSNGAGASASGQISVVAAPCVRRAPSLSFVTAPPLQAQAGAPLVTEIRLVNTDDAWCGTSAFELSAAGPQGWPISMPPTVTVAPGTAMTVPIASTPPNSAGGPYTVFASASRPAVSALSVQRSCAVTVSPKAWPMRRRSSIVDFDGDGRSDLAVYRPQTGEWLVRRSSRDYDYGDVLSMAWGLANDVPVSGDFDADGRIDPAVFRPDTGEWFVRLSADGYDNRAWVVHTWGLAGDVPISADLDGDRRNDLIVYRPNEGMWYVRSSSSQFANVLAFRWGLPADRPMSGDIDGDGRDDLIVFRPSTGEWHVAFVAAGGDGRVIALQWGLPEDVPILADVDGDGRADFTVYRPSTGTWFSRLSGTEYATWIARQWGLPGDVPINADFDGDGRADLAVWRPSLGRWFVRPSSSLAGQWQWYEWGLPTDYPIAR